MKKRFFAIYALIGAFIASPIFTSCVEDEESTSVTAIRDAKTQELKSIAALKKAEAEAEAALAAANIALKAAEAEYQLAMARWNEAQKALQETRNEEEAVALLIAKKEAEAELARIQGEIEQQEILLQAALLDAQKDLLNAKQELERITKQYSDQEKAELMSLANKYSQTVQDMLQAKKQLVAMESTLASYETGLADAKAGLEETIAYWNNQIAQSNIYIETYKLYTNYTEDMDALKLQQTEAQVAYNLAADKYNAANTAWLNANSDVDRESLDELRQAIEEDAFYRFTRNNEYYDAESESYKHYLNFDYNLYYAIRYDENGSRAFNTTYGTYSLNCEYLDRSYYYGDSISYEFEYLMDIRKTELRFGQYIDPIKANIKTTQDAITADKTALETAKAATVAAKKAWDDAAEADKDAKKAEYVAALNAETALADNIKSNEALVEALNKDLAIWTSALDMLKNAETLEAALQEKIEAYNDAVKAAYAPVVEAWKAAVDAEVVMNEADAELQAINAVINGGSWTYGAERLAQLIENHENNIKYYQEQIENAEKLLANYSVNGELLSYEDLIAFQKAQIEAQKAIVAAKEVAVAEAKAALDAAMPAEEEDAPAEE